MSLRANPQADNPLRRLGNAMLTVHAGVVTGEAAKNPLSFGAHVA